MTGLWPLAVSTWGMEERRAARKVIDSGQTTCGPIVKDFEDRFAAWTGDQYCVMVNSGSSANLLAVLAAYDDYIDTKWTPTAPAVAWATTYSPFAVIGAELDIVDVSPLTLNAVQETTVKVNLLGAVANNHPAVVEDNCQALGAIGPNGLRAGARSVLSTYSFFFSHHICTMEGGAICTDSRELYRRLVSMRSHGWSRGQPSFAKAVPPPPDRLAKDFYFVEPCAFNVRPTEVAAAIGLEQMNKLNGFLHWRQENARMFWETVNPDLAAVADVPCYDRGSSAFAFAFKVRGRRQVLADRLRKAGIDCRPVAAGAWHRQPAAQDSVFHVKRYLPVADDIHKNWLMIGNSHRPITKKQREVLLSCLKRKVV